jgi:dihydrofolate reductase
MPDRRASVFIATSLDGFIARENGDLDWLPVPEAGGDDYGYGDFMKSVDALVIGRKTYEKMLTLGGWSYGAKRIVVLTSRPIDAPSAGANVEAMSGEPAEIVERLAASGAPRLYVDGGETIRRFLAGGLIQRIIITQIPVLIGRGIPLFGPLDRDIELRHVVTRSWPNGMVQSEYLVAST